MSEEAPPVERAFAGSVKTDEDVSTAMMQVINYEEEFNAELGQFLAKNKIAQLGFDYNVTAIMGPQSSGKSTLLNLLFGTSFRTMDAHQGRYQVTQGVWLGRDDARGIVVMDLEGTDSRERGEDAASFERKSALFALALAEVLIVNIWTQDVGRFNAANLSLLKTVMELDLQLFFSSDVSADQERSPRRQGHKTKLLFVLRDHVATPLERLESTLRTDVDNIWNSISKPEAAAGTEVADYFDLEFFALPHKVLMEKEFIEQAQALRRQFIEGDMFLDEYKRNVAADGFATYADSVWGTIRENKELDIPSQKEMLAHVRCEQIARDAIDAAEAKLAPLAEALKQSDVGIVETVPELFKQLQSICNDALQLYDDGAYRYSKKVAQLKGQDLREKLGNDSKAIFDAQIAIASDNALKSLEKRLFNRKASTKQGGSVAPWDNWGTVSEEARKAVLDDFDAATACDAVEDSDANVGEHPLAFATGSVVLARKRLVSSLDVELSRATEDAKAKAREFCLQTFQESFKPNLISVLEKPSEDIWDRTSEVTAVSWELTKTKSQSVFGTEGLGLEGDELEAELEDQLKPECLERTIRDIEDVIGTPSTFLHRMTKRFDDLFRFDERGVPRSFGPNEDLETLFMSAREEAEKLTDLLGEIKLSGPLTVLRETTRSLGGDSSSPRKIFEAHHKLDLREKLHRQAGAVFMEARRAQEAAKITTRIPIWLFVMLIVFGWNEIMAVFRNPVLLMLCLVFGPLAYVLYASGNATVLVPAVRAMVAPFVQQAQQYVDNIGVPPIDGPPPPVTANGPGTDESKNT